MLIPTKKLPNGFEIPVFGLGTWLMGGGMKYNPQDDDKKHIQAIVNAIETGVTLIDTAEIYAEGHTDEIIAQAIKGFDRKKLFLISKVKQHLEYENVIKSCEASLKRLKTDYVDLFLLHKPNPEIPIEETIRALDRLVADGLIRNYGVCNFSVPRLKEVKQFTDKIVLNQLHYNLIIREVEKKGVLEYCQKNDIILQTWRPLQQGVLCQTGTKIVDEMCKKYKRTPAQIALNWLISQKNVTAISKMDSIEHLRENIGALNFEMEVEDIEKLRKEYPSQQSISDVSKLI